ncbi:MAG: helix-turn-helix domain-containing protein [Oscillospiraceae bacterium]|jgi:DNA-binding XRE family transcriptional regulator|nr:helix-turn-helix domain-containing protein [Oscillospiraceae bacterium]
MQIAEIITQLRKDRGLSQEGLAGRLFVTRQAVSKWERGLAYPESDVILRISKEFGIPVATLMGAPEERICQSCGMPMNGTGQVSEHNAGYCAWCYGEGGYTSPVTMEEMAEHVISMGGAPPEFWPDADTARRFLYALYPELERWKAS